MMTEANKDSVEKRIAVWKEKVAPGSKMNWVYIGGAVVIVFLLIAYFTKGKKKVAVRNEEKTE